MALKRKIDKSAFDALSDDFKSHYKEVNGTYVLDTDEAKELENALDRQKEDNARLRTELDTMRADLQTIRDEAATANADKNRKNKDYEGLEADYNRKLEAKKTEFDNQQNKLKATIQKMLVDNKALELANELGGENADILIPHIKSRLQADFEGETPATRVLDKNGQPSASNLDDLKKEFVDNPRFAPILVGTRASGGHANGQPANGHAGNKKPQEMDAQERAALLKSNPEAFYQAFPQARVA